MSTVLASANRRTEPLFWHRLLLDRLHRLFAIVIVLQLVQCFGEYWWDETFGVVYAACAAYAVTELLIPRAFAARLAIQIVASCAAVVWLTDFVWYGWPDSWRSWDAIRMFLEWHGKQFHPYVELAAGSLLVAHFMAYVGSNKTRAIVFILTSVAALSVVDSFMPLELWRNIAWTVLAGLGWLFVLHLRTLRERHSDSWNALAERPLTLLVPAIVVIGMLVAIGMAMPRAPALLEDPYTIWLQAQNKEVPSFSGEGGLLSRSSSSSQSALSSTSGYGRDDTEIGGGFRFDYSPVMEVATSRRSYWRGETKAVYSGKGWSDRNGLETVPAAAGMSDLPMDPEIPEGVETRQVTQTVTMLREERTPVLFAAGPASSVGAVDASGNARLNWDPEEWELKFQRPARVESYTVVSEVPVLDVAVLSALPTIPEDGRTSIDVDPYLQLPESLPSRVRDLAAEATSGATGDYDRLKKLEQYLRTAYPYTNEPDISKQRSEDIVDAFLFEIQEGYCDYFSTAFVVMARSLGLPARWVKGYTSGFDPSMEEQMRLGGYQPDPDGAGTYTVRNADAHSWAEVYFEGYGWVSFEPTAGFSMPVAEVEPTAELPEATTEPVTETATEQPAEQASGRSPALPIAASAVAVVLLLAAAWAWFRRRALMDAWRQFRNRGTTPNQRIVRETERLIRFLKRKGFKHDPHETLRETVSGWSGRLQTLGPDFEHVLQQFEHARYAGGTGDEETYRRFIAAADKIRKSL
ncbi:transglutaminase domain-containing protein [Cohnella algarum]|uniref:transglutaminase domain-containing protein n=1 Tax=Cohnella algarum TaxID=2044859 RepID=UPI0019674949|nr:transglutaminase domain-containing protein [Cohnella algarum]